MAESKWSHSWCYECRLLRQKSLGFYQSKCKNNRTPLEIYSVARKLIIGTKAFTLRILSFISLSIIEIFLLYKLGPRPIKGSPSIKYKKKINWNKEQSELWIIHSQCYKHSQLSDSYLWHKFRVILECIVKLKFMKSKFVASKLQID